MDQLQLSSLRLPTVLLLLGFRLHADLAPVIGWSTSPRKPSSVDVALLLRLPPADVALPPADVAPVVGFLLEPLPVPAAPLPIGATPPTVDDADSAAPA